MRITDYMDVHDFVYETAVELAEQFTDDFQTQEEFIEGVLTAYTAVADAKLIAVQPPAP